MKDALRETLRELLEEELEEVEHTQQGINELLENANLVMDKLHESDLDNA